MKTTYNTDIQIFRILEGELVSSNCEIKIALDTEKITNVEIHSQKILEIKLWLESILNNSIIVENTTVSDAPFYKFVEQLELSNNIVYCPSEPNDVTLTVLIHSKLNAIGQGYIKITETTLQTDTGDGFSNIFSGDVNDWLPSATEWLGDRRYFDNAWWHRSDGSTIDVLCNETDDINQKPNITFDLSDIITDEDDDIVPKSMQAEIIKPTFIPRIIK